MFLSLLASLLFLGLFGCVVAVVGRRRQRRSRTSSEKVRPVSGNGVVRSRTGGNTSSRWFRRPYCGVTAYVGPPGSGKTYSLVEIGLAALRAGRPVFTNLGFRITDEATGRFSEVYKSLEEMLLVPDGSVILLDEAPTQFSARRWQEFPDALMYRLTQIRKDGLQFHYSAIHESFVDKVLREMTINWWTCKRLPIFPLFVRARWSPHAFRKATQRPERRDWVRLRPVVCDAYDTSAKVAVPERVWVRLRETSAEEWLTIDEWDRREKQRLCFHEGRGHCGKCGAKIHEVVWDADAS